MRCDFDSPGQLNVKTRPPLALYFGFSILLVFNRWSSFCIFRKFSVNLGFQYSHPHPDSPLFLKFFFLRVDL